jgi:5'-3' exonuclease
MEIYLVDGTYELFRHFFALPDSQDDSGQEIAATRGVVNSMLSLLTSGVTHIGVATDHVVESFRNDLYAGYKTSEGVPPELLSQFEIVEEALTALGVKVWPMVEFEADDALAAAAKKAAKLDEVERVVICTPDKDLGQCVSGTRVVQMDRRKDVITDEKGIVTKFGVSPHSIPDYLALVGDSADGFPGLAGWGSKGAAAILAEYEHLDKIPKDTTKWKPKIRGAAKLAETLFDNFDDAMLYRKLATLRFDVDVFKNIDELKWQGPTEKFEELCERLKAKNAFKRATKLAESI